MTVARELFSGRRWILWVPIPASMVLCGGSVTEIGKMLVGGVPLWIPFWLAWWLSDGFDTVTVGNDGAGLEYKPSVNPATGQACSTLSDRDTGAPLAWFGCDRRPDGRS